MTGFRTRLDYTSWGRVASVPHEVAVPSYSDEVGGLLSREGGPSTLAVGLRRSYGDSNLNAHGRLIDMTRLDRFIAFDKEAGIVRCEAGLSLSDLLDLVVPAGWFLPTTPGTRFVTVGGAIANDVHGKNHHSAGSFGCAVRAILLQRGGEPPQEVLPGSELFAATVGGLGLTGVVLEAEIALTRIGSAFLENERVPFDSVEEFFAIAEASQAFEHTVAWIDCAAGGERLGRGVFQRANWLGDGELTARGGAKRPGLPVDFPGWALNRHSIRAFNAFYNWLQRRGPDRQRVHYQPFFYPLDAIGNWNRMYGPAGFYQYQCVLPAEGGAAGVRQLLDTIAQSGQGSFLAVLKTLGARSSGGLLSFPMEGPTLALDFANRGARTLHLMKRLDDIVLGAGGRLYPAKDGRMPAALFQAGYPRWREFAHLKDPTVNSSFWERVSRS